LQASGAFRKISRRIRLQLILIAKTGIPTALRVLTNIEFDCTFTEQFNTNQLATAPVKNFETRIRLNSVFAKMARKVRCMLEEVSLIYSRKFRTDRWQILPPAS